MKLIIAASFSLLAGIAHAESKLDIPVEVSTVEIAQQPRWEVVRNVSHGEATTIVATGEQAGGMCHELAVEKVVVCVFRGPKDVGYDWEKVIKQMGAS